jgi:hypothetical protein
MVAMKTHKIILIATGVLAILFVGHLVPIATRYADTNCFDGAQVHEKLLPKNIHALSHPVAFGGAENCIGTPGKVKIIYTLW